MAKPTTEDLAAAILLVSNASCQLQETAETVADAIQAAVTQVEEAAGRLDLNDLEDNAVDRAVELADEVAKMHAALHDGPLRWCTQLVCRMADEVRTP